MLAEDILASQEGCYCMELVWHVSTWGVMPHMCPYQVGYILFHFYVTTLKYGLSFFSFHLLIVVHKFRFGVVHYFFELSLADCCLHTLIWNKMCKPVSSPLIWGTTPLDQHALYCQFQRCWKCFKIWHGNVGNSWIGQQNGGSMKHQWPLIPNILCPCNLQRCWWKAAYSNWQCSFASCPL